MSSKPIMHFDFDGLALTDLFNRAGEVVMTKEQYNDWCEGGELYDEANAIAAKIIPNYKPNDHYNIDKFLLACGYGQEYERRADIEEIISQAEHDASMTQVDLKGMFSELEHRADNGEVRLNEEMPQRPCTKGGV